MIPQTPTLPSYMRSMHAGMPLRGEIMGMGGMALPAGNRDDLPFNYYQYTSLQLAEDKRRIQNDKIGRGRYFQAEPNFKEHCPKNDREATAKFHKEREPCKSCSDDSFARKMHRKHLHVEKRREKSRSSSASRDKVTRHSDRCNDDFPSSSDKHRRGSHQHRSQDPRKRYECDSTLGHCEVSDRKRGANCHERGSQLKDHPSSVLEPSSPVHQTARSKERRGFGHDAKHSRHHARHSIDDVHDNKKWMSSSSFEDCRDGYHHKRKRDH